MAKGKVFKRRFRIRADRIARNTHDAVKKVALVIDQAVVLGTPVDTGRARSNWIVTIGTPSSSTIAPYAPGSRLGIGEGANAGSALAHAHQVVATKQISDTRIFITNNVHYIGRLNRPPQWSAQASPHFVEKAISAALSVLRKTRLMK